MKKLLFVNACIRENSRTEELSRRYLEKLNAENNEYEIEEERVTALDIKPFDAEALAKRDADAAQGRLDS